MQFLITGGIQLRADFQKFQVTELCFKIWSRWNHERLNCIPCPPLPTHVIGWGPNTQWDGFWRWGSWGVNIWIWGTHSIHPMVIKNLTHRIDVRFKWTDSSARLGTVPGTEQVLPDFLAVLIIGKKKNYGFIKAASYSLRQWLHFGKWWIISGVLLSTLLAHRGQRWPPATCSLSCGALGPSGEWEATGPLMPWDLAVNSLVVSPHSSEWGGLQSVVRRWLDWTAVPVRIFTFAGQVCPKKARCSRARLGWALGSINLCSLWIQPSASGNITSVGEWKSE